MREKIMIKCANLRDASKKPNKALQNFAGCWRLKRGYLTC